MSNRVVLAAVLTLAVTAACAGPASPRPDAPADAGAAGAAVTVTSCGQPLSFAQPPERVVTLDQSSTEILLELGLQDRMAGTSNIKTRIAGEYQEAYAKVPVLSPKILTAEQLRAATPDFVVGSFTDLYTKDRVGTREELRELGVPSFVSAVHCPNDSKQGPFDLLFADYVSFGRIFGVEERAARLIADQRAVLRQASMIQPRVSGRPSIVWIYSAFQGLPYVAGGQSLPTEMSRLVGARNAFDDVDEYWPEVSWEQIVERDPDIIVLADLSERGRPGDTAQEKIDLLRKHPTVSKLRAVRENRIVQVPGIELDPSVRSVDTLDRLVRSMRDLGHVG